MNLIAAVDKNWAIGNKNKLLVRIPDDQKFFRETTTGKVVVMGRKTLESFPNGLPLKNRTNIVLYPNGEKRDDCVVVGSLSELYEELKKYEKDDVFIIGGAMFYKTMLPYCDEVFVTKVDADGEAEVFFENLDQKKEWKLLSESEKVNTNGYDIKFTVYKNDEVKEF